MFFLKKFEKEVALHPMYLSKGDHPEEVVKVFCYHGVEGTMQPNIGYVIAIHEILDIKGGFIQPMSGKILYTCTINAIVLRPLVNEIVDVEVTHIDPDYVLFVYCGFVTGTISFTKLGDAPCDFLFVEESQEDVRNDTGTKRWIKYIPNEAKNIYIGSIVRARIEVVTCTDRMFIVASAAECGSRIVDSNK